MDLNKHIYLLIIFLLAAGNCFSQSGGAKEYAKLKANYSSEAAVMIRNSEEIRIEIINKELSMASTVNEDRILLDNRAGLYSEHSLSYGEFDKIIDIQASTFILQKNNYKEVKVKDFKTTDKLSKSVFYDGGKNVSFFYPSLEAGAKTHLEYTKNISQPRFMPSFFFQDFTPVIESVYTIIAPPEVEIGWKIFNIADSSVVFTKTFNKNKVIYTWTAKKLKAHKSEENAPNYLYSLGHIVAWVKSYKADGQEFPVLRSYQDLYHWYYNISKNSDKERSTELQNLVDSLTKGVKSEPEKVKNIFYWVQDNIRYIAIEDGMGGFVPRSAKTVFEKRYGDCKDMANIISKMLSYAGIPSYLTWIGSRHIPYRYEDVPSTCVDNHMIATYINKGQYYFLDATGIYTPFGMSTSFIQGKQALIGKDSLTPEIKEVPIAPKELSTTHDSLIVDISGNKIVGKGSSQFTGYNRLDLVERLANHRSDKGKILKEVLRKGSNKFLIDSYDMANLDDRDKPLKVKYEFNVEDYVKNIADEIYIDLNLNKDLFIEEIDNDRKIDVEKSHKETLASVVRLAIPQGYKVTYLPPVQSFHDDKFGFDIAYEQTQNAVTLRQKIYYNFIFLNKKDFDQWNKFTKALKRAYTEGLVLERKSKTQ